MTLQENSFVSKSSATESVRSSVSTLNSIRDGIRCDEICDTIAHHYSITHGIPNSKVTIVYASCHACLFTLEYILI